MLLLLLYLLFLSFLLLSLLLLFSFLLSLLLLFYSIIPMLRTNQPSTQLNNFCSYLGFFKVSLSFTNAAVDKPPIYLPWCIRALNQILNQILDINYLDASRLNRPTVFHLSLYTPSTVIVTWEIQELEIAPFCREAIFVHFSMKNFQAWKCWRCGAKKCCMGIRQPVL